MWKSIPALVQLRKDIQRYIDDTVQVGGEQDYVTLAHLMTEYSCLHPETRRHHPDQLLQAFKDVMKDRGKWVDDVVVSDEPLPDGEFCMGCGELSKRGYCDAYQFVKLKTGKVCGYNYSSKCCKGSCSPGFL